MKKKIVAVTALVLLGLTGCTRPTQKSAPEPEPAGIKAGTNTQVIQLPDGFRNVAFTCWGTTGVYVTSRGAYANGNADFTALPSGLSTVPSDPMCR